MRAHAALSRVLMVAVALSAASLVNSPTPRRNVASIQAPAVSVSEVALPLDDDGVLDSMVVGQRPAALFTWGRKEADVKAIKTRTRRAGRTASVRHALPPSLVGVRTTRGGGSLLLECTGRW